MNLNKTNIIIASVIFITAAIVIYIGFNGINNELKKSLPEKTFKNQQN